jgi:hypothetical protein
LSKGTVPPVKLFLGVFLLALCHHISAVNSSPLSALLRNSNSKECPFLRRTLDQKTFFAVFGTFTSK